MAHQLPVTNQTILKKMPKKMILLFSHKLTCAQIQEAKHIYNISTFASLPDDLQTTWSNIPDNLEKLSDHLKPVKKWLSEIAKPMDYILIQGEFGAVYFFVNWAFQNKLIPIHATTKRVHKEIELENGKIEVKKIFQHTKFRKYTPDL